MADSPFDRALPSNVEAERSILGAILLDNSTINQAAEMLRRDDFFLDSHRRIFDKMLLLMEQGRAIDPITLADALKRTGDLDLIGGAAFIGSLIDGVPRFSNIEEYCRIVKGKSVVRKLITTSNQIINRCFDAEDEPDTLLDEAERSILAIAEDRIRQGFVPISEVAHKQLQHIEEIAGREQLVTGISTGFRDLDYMTSGLQRGDMVIIAARPSMGKCLAANAEIVQSDGSIATIEELYERRAARLLTLQNNWRFTWTKPSAFIDDGIKPLFRITTKLGRVVESTITHPFLTVDGWRQLAELNTGTKIAVPRVLNVFGRQQLDPLEITALVRSSLRRQDLLSSAIGVQVATALPETVFRLTRACLAEFLRQFLLLTNSVIGPVDAVTAIDFHSANEKLVRQLQHLFLRFGLLARVQRVSDEWILQLTDQDGLQSLQQLLASSTVPDVQAKTQSEIYWDEIVAIEFVGNQQVYDLTIPTTHNFVANDICVHNTAFCLNIAQNAALRQQHHGKTAIVGIFSLEMSKEQLVQRMLCSQARIDAHRLRTGMLSKDDWRHLAMGVSELAEASIFLDDTPAISALEMRAKCRRLKNEQRGLDLIIVDYLQLMSGKGKNESRQQEVSQISRDLKAIAKEMDVPVIALSQLSRAVETRSDHRPQLSDLRESGSIEQDADLVMFIYRDDVYNPETEKQNIAEIIIGKQRNGPIGDVELVFIKQLTRFEDKYRE